MKVNLAYGQNGLEIEVPDHAMVIEPTYVPGLVDDHGAVLAALRNSIDSPPLRDLVKPSDKVCIVISDITRPTPNHKLIPWLLEELSFVPRRNFVILNGTGSHRDNTREELIAMLGAEVVESVRVVNNNAQDKGTYSYLGRTSQGAEAYLDREYVESDVRIATGFIEPHFFAGFSGGPKAIMPGIAAIETILHFHSAKMIGDPSSTWGVLDGNPVQAEAVEITAMCPAHFSLNVTLNGDKEITAVFAGNLMASHRAGCAYVKEHAMAACAEPFDIVVTTNSGYPLDQNLYQAVKGMSAALGIVKRGGAIICAAECSDGLPDHGNFAKILQMRDSPAELLRMIEDPGFSMFDQWQVQKQAVVQTWADVHLYSTLPDDVARQAMMKPVTSIGETLGELGADHKSVAVMPLGPLTIPYMATHA